MQFATQRGKISSAVLAGCQIKPEEGTVSSEKRLSDGKTEAPSELMQSRNFCVLFMSSDGF